MKLLLQSAKILDSTSAHHLKTKDIYIENGLIQAIQNAGADHPNKSAYTPIQSNQLHVSTGWVDMNVVNTEPGYEHRDDYQSLSKTAIAGGYTHIGLMPNTEPVADHKNNIEAIISADKRLLISLIPYGSITQGAQGKEIAELYDMHTHGAKAFSDGNGAVVSKPVLKRALQYNQAFDGLILWHAEEASLTEDGMVHEGEISVAMGLKGRPALAEEMGVLQGIHLAEYTQGRLHLMNISAERSLEFIRQAKAKKLPITASVNGYQLYLNHEQMLDFDTNYKVNPPLRSEADRKALIHAVLDGTIDVITSAHTPLDEEVKKLEFDLAAYGMMTLPFNFQMILGAMSGVPAEKWIDSITIHPRKILGLEQPQIEVGQQACLTLFDPTVQHALKLQNNPSKSNNSPFFDKNMTGKVIGLIHKNQYHINA